MSFQTESTAKRNMLALLRTRLANERTLLSYIRTSLYFIVGGLALLNVERFENLVFIGWLCFAISISLLCIGLRRFITLQKKLEK
ncbi:MAG: DUF202 domain-containing protein [Balneolaceae bacterium]